MNSILQKTIQFLKDKIVKQQVFDSLPQDDIMDRQRFVVFRLFSFFGSLICLAIATREYVDLENYSTNIYFVLSLSLFLLINYLRISHANQLKLASTLMLIATIFLLHVVSYTAGGIQNAGILFYGVVIIYAFMLLGSKGGVFITSVVFLNGIYIYYVSNFTNLTSDTVFHGDQKLINNDFITNLIFSSALFAILSDYMQNGRKHLIMHLIKTRDEVKEKNEALYVNNNVLEKKNMELDKFASIASHDLRSPLRAIGSLSDMILEDDPNLSIDSKEKLNIIRNRVQRMDDLLNALLEYSRADRGVKKLALTDVNEIIRPIVERRKNDKPVNILTHNLPVINTNSSKLEQVFDILITNSIRFNKENQINIEISSRETDHHFLFFVKDNGPGIDPAYHEKIFVIFQTLETRDKFESAGVGLAIAKKIVDENGGAIKVNSNKGEGASFEFTWKKIAA